MDRSRSELTYLISEWVFNKRDKEILIDKMLDGLTGRKKEAGIQEVHSANGNDVTNQPINGREER
jgi:hypothetical protein